MGAFAFCFVSLLTWSPGQLLGASLAMIHPDVLLHEWQAFQQTGRCDEAKIAPQILRSWQRCMALAAPSSYPSTQSPELPVELEQTQSALVTLARPYMEDLYQFVEGSGFAVMLVDAALVILEVIGDMPILTELQELGLLRGVQLVEEKVGTLALNLALSEALPWQTQGPEHYCRCFHNVACSAAPIFDVSGQAMGLIGVIGPAVAVHAHTLGMVIAVTQAIQAQLRNNMLLAETHAHLGALNAAIEAMSEGLILLDIQGHISKINSRAAQMLGLSMHSAAGRPLNELIELPSTLAIAIEHRRSINDQELLFPGHQDSVVVLGSVRSVWERSQRYLGALITLRPADSVQRLVQRVVGAQARFSFADVTGESVAIQIALRLARIAANSPAPVLLIGELGVGKNVFAHAIHNASARADEAFVMLNCAAVFRTLLLGELLGYEGGQAEHPEGRPGKFELARAGTLLLEDVDALTMEAQTVLLRVIDTRSLIRVGGQRVIPVDLRIIATCTGDLEQAVAAGRFRADLFYRLSVLSIDIPPLRARGDDILLLLDHILGLMTQRLGRKVLFTPEALSALRAYHWPGNIRELEAVLETVLHASEKSVLTLSDLPQNITQALVNAAPHSSQSRLYDLQASAEREALLRAGREAAGHLGRMATTLGISRATLWRKMKLYGLTKAHFWQTSV